MEFNVLMELDKYEKKITENFDNELYRCAVIESPLISYSHNVMGCFLKIIAAIEIKSYEDKVYSFKKFINKVRVILNSKRKLIFFNGIFDYVSLDHKTNLGTLSTKSNRDDFDNFINNLEISFFSILYDLRNVLDEDDKEMLKNNKTSFKIINKMKNMTDYNFGVDSNCMFNKIGEIKIEGIHRELFNLMILNQLESSHIDSESVVFIGLQNELSESKEEYKENIDLVLDKLENKYLKTKNINISNKDENKFSQIEKILEYLIDDVLSDTIKEKIIKLLRNLNEVSLKNKTLMREELMGVYNFNVFYITEKWHNIINLEAKKKRLLNEITKEDLNLILELNLENIWKEEKLMTKNDIYLVSYMDAENELLDIISYEVKDEKERELQVLALQKVLNSIFNINNPYQEAITVKNYYKNRYYIAIMDYISLKEHNEKIKILDEIKQNKFFDHEENLVHNYTNMKKIIIKEKLKSDKSYNQVVEEHELLYNMLMTVDESILPFYCNKFSSKYLELNRNKGSNLIDISLKTPMKINSVNEAIMMISEMDENIPNALFNNNVKLVDNYMSSKFRERDLLNKLQKQEGLTYKNEIIERKKI